MTTIDSLRTRPQDCALLVIDIQEKLFRVMDPSRQEQVEKNTKILMKCAETLDMPIIISEQYPRGLGPTIEPIAELLTNTPLFEKTFFDCMKDTAINSTMQSIKRNCIILTGIETHVCVFQTALSLLEEGRRVVIASDAVASRRDHDRHMALSSLRTAGALIYPAETIAFMLLEKAGTPEFKALSPLFR